MNMRLHRQKGAALVEMAIVLLLFLMIVFAVLEFSIAMLRSAQLAEATRYGLRYAIVNDPLVELSACPDMDATEVPDVKECGTEDCEGLIEGMANIAPMINIQDDINVTVKYTCPASGYVERDDLYLVTVTVSGAKYYPAVPGILGLGVAIDLQAFKSTRLSEDLHTAVSGG